MRRLFGCLLCAVALAGCGTKPNPATVTGKVVGKDGSPLTAGSIYLHPAAGNTWKGEPPTSVLQVDGSFAMKTLPHGDGVPPGSWKVTLSPGLASRVGKPDLGDPAKTPWTLDVPADGVRDKSFEVK